MAAGNDMRAVDYTAQKLDIRPGIARFIVDYTVSKRREGWDAKRIATALRAWFDVSNIDATFVRSALDAHDRERA